MFQEKIVTVFATGIISFVAVYFMKTFVLPRVTWSFFRRVTGVETHLNLSPSQVSSEPKQHRGPQQAVSSKIEPTSRSNFLKVATTHLSFDLNVDFTRKIVAGTITFTLLRRDESIEEVVFDSRDLTIIECFTKAKDEDLFLATDFVLSEPPHPIFGSALKVRLNPTTSQVMVRYETTTNSSALQWLTPAQTAGKSYPYLFTQSQAIHARSFFPCQDAPGVKATYDAKITVPSPLVALMSAVSVGSTKQGTSTIFSFKQQVPCPSYLVALAVGDLESRELGPRSRVWSEPSMVELAQREFVDTEKFLSTAEQLCGEYVWGRYDLLLLPPSFPYGGMENPCLVFLTPTLLAGDRSLVNVVAHEISHSWFGNLVTNSTWEDFWMNEGFTVFAERRIIAKLFGESRAGLKAVLGKRHWKEDVDRYGEDHDFTKLHINMKDVDPDDSFSSVPYEKGCAFLEHIEKLVGGPAVFEPFLKEYVAKFKFGFVEVQSFQNCLLEKFPELQIDWNLWVYQPGIPPGSMEVKDNVLVALSESCADKWVKNGSQPEESRGANTSWSSDQLTVFLERLVLIQAEDQTSVTDKLLEAIDDYFRFSESRNSEIRFKWNTLALRMPKPTPACFEDTVEFLSEQGRMKFVRPLYRDLNKANRELAVATFVKNKENYHLIAQKMIAKDLSLSSL